MKEGCRPALAHVPPNLLGGQHGLCQGVGAVLLSELLEQRQQLLTTLSVVLGHGAVLGLQRIDDGLELAGLLQQHGVEAKELVAHWLQELSA